MGTEEFIKSTRKLLDELEERRNNWELPPDMLPFDIKEIVWELVIEAIAYIREE